MSFHFSEEYSWKYTSSTHLCRSTIKHIKLYRQQILIK